MAPNVNSHMANMNLWENSNQQMPSINLKHATPSMRDSIALTALDACSDMMTELWKKSNSISTPQEFIFPLTLIELTLNSLRKKIKICQIKRDSLFFNKLHQEKTLQCQFNSITNCPLII